jgi:alpha-glucosidase
MKQSSWKKKKIANIMKNPDAWWKYGVIYEISPRSYLDTNNDGYGDINGIIQKLDYLVDLGIDAIWLMPINPTPDVDFGYDVSDYRGIDFRLGTMADFERLLIEAHKRNIHIIIDLVLNHTSDQHPWFQEARKSRDNPFHDYYLWQEPSKFGKEPNNWQSAFGGKAWEFVPEVGQYYYHMFCKEQPDLNWRNPNVRTELMDVFRFWLTKGVDGFRLDVFNVYFKDDNFRGNPVKIMGPRPFDWQEHIHDCDQPEFIDVLKEIRAILDDFPGSYCIGETFLSNAQKAARYSGMGMLPAAFNFEMCFAPLNAKRMFKAIQNQETALAEDAWPTIALSNHDRPRPGTRYGDTKNDSKQKLAAFLLLTLRGTPFIYYGDEIGMRDVHLKRSEILDSVGKHYWPAPVGRDRYKAPMQWDGTINAGFSRIKPFIKLHPDFPRRNLKMMQSEKSSLFSFYKNLIKVRKEHPALFKGLYLPLTYDPLFVLAYLRQTMDETVLVVLNFSNRKMKFFLGQALATRKRRLLFSTHDREDEKHHPGYMELKGYESSIFLLE